MDNVENPLEQKQQHVWKHSYKINELYWMHDTNIMTFILDNIARVDFILSNIVHVDSSKLFRSFHLPPPTPLI